VGLPWQMAGSIVMRKIGVCIARLRMPVASL